MLAIIGVLCVAAITITSLACGINHLTAGGGFAAITGIISGVAVKLKKDKDIKTIIEKAVKDTEA